MLKGIFLMLKGICLMLKGIFLMLKGVFLMLKGIFMVIWAGGTVQVSWSRAYRPLAWCMALFTREF